MQNFHNEYEFQRAVETLANQYEWEVRHIPQKAYQVAVEAGSPIPAGIPDLELRYYAEGQSNPIIVFAELKMSNPESDRLNNAQEHYLKGFAHIVPCFLWRPQNWNWIESILQCGPPKPTGEIIEATSSPPINTDPLPPDRNIYAIVRKMANDIGISDFPRGDLAALRRMDPESPDAAAFWRLTARYDVLRGAELERKWGLILHGIALMTRTAGEDVAGKSAHVRAMPIGKALFTGGDTNRASAFYSESRLNRLLTARGAMLRTLLARMFRMMTAAAQGFDWYQMAQLILYDGYDDDRANQIRRNIARDYYWAENRASR